MYITIIYKIDKAGAGNVDADPARADESAVANCGSYIVAAILLDLTPQLTLLFSVDGGRRRGCRNIGLSLTLKDQERTDHGAASQSASR